MANEHTLAYIPSVDPCPYPGCLDFSAHSHRGRPPTDNPSPKTEANRRSEIRAASLDNPKTWLRLPAYDGREQYDLDRIAHFCSDYIVVVDGHVHIRSWRGLWQRHDPRDETPLSVTLLLAYSRLAEYAVKEGMNPEYIALVESDKSRITSNHLQSLNRRVRELSSEVEYPHVERIQSEQYDDFAAHPVIALFSGGAIDLTQDKVLTPDELAKLYISDRESLAVDYDPSVQHTLAQNLIVKHYPSEILDIIAFAFAAPASHHFATLINEMSGAGKTTLFEWVGWSTGSCQVMPSPKQVYRSSPYTELEIALCESHIVMVDECDANKNTNPKGEPIPLPFGKINELLARELWLNPKGRSQYKAKRLGIPVLVAGDTIFVMNHQGIPNRLLASWRGAFPGGARIPDNTRRAIERDTVAHQYMLADLVRRARAIYQRIVQKGMDHTIEYLRFGGSTVNTSMVKARARLLHPQNDPNVQTVKRYFRDAAPGDTPVTSDDIPEHLRKMSSKAFSAAMQTAFGSQSKRVTINGQKVTVWTNVALIEDSEDDNKDGDDLVACVECGEEVKLSEGVPSFMAYCPNCLSF